MGFPTDTQLKAFCMAAKVIQTATYPVNAILEAFQTPAVAPDVRLDTDYASVVAGERTVKARDRRAPYRMQFKRVAVTS